MLLSAQLFASLHLSFVLFSVFILLFFFFKYSSAAVILELSSKAKSLLSLFSITTTFLLTQSFVALWRCYLISAQSFCVGTASDEYFSCLG